MVDGRGHLGDQLREAQRTARRVMAEGVLWLVYEVPACALDRRSSPSLVFESDDVIRRVRTYPSGWRELSDADLLDVSWSA